MPPPTRTEAERAAAGGPAPPAARAPASPPAPPLPPPQKTVPRPALVVAAERGGRTVLETLCPASPWAPRPLPSSRADGTGTRVALVQTAATLLAGDDCGIELRVEAGAALTVVETGATIAHHVRGGAPARLRIRIVVAEEGRLEWLARPLVLAAGCDLQRETTIELAAGARALVRETVVLGRSGEEPGALRATTRATLAGRPLLHERLETGVTRLLRSPLVAGPAATLDTLLLLGARGAELPGATQLAGPGTLWRALHARGADPDGPALAVARIWRA